MASEAGHASVEIRAGAATANTPAANRLAPWKAALAERSVNFINTADSYGPETNESVISQALYPYPPGLVCPSGRFVASKKILEGLKTRRPSEHQPRRAASIAATSIFFMPIMASNARFASAPPAAIASVSTRGVICQEMPHLSLHQPHALS